MSTRTRLKTQTRGLLRRQNPILYFSVRIADALAILTSGALVYGLRFDGVDLLGKYMTVAAIGAALASLYFPRAGVYRNWRGDHVLINFQRLLIAWLAVAVTLLTIAFLTKTTTLISRQWFVLWVASAVPLFAAYRALLRLLLAKYRRHHWQKTRIVIVGAGDLARDVARRIDAARWSGFEIEGFFADADADRVAHHPVLGPIESLETSLTGPDGRAKVEEVWIALPLDDYGRVREVVHRLRHVPVAIRFIPDIFEFRLINHDISQIEGIPVIDLNVTPMVGTNRILKAIEDYVLASLILVSISPLMLAIAIGVRLSSPGPILYRQERVSWNGQTFEMLKFRSMPVTAEDETGPKWATPGEGRATPFGRFLRRTSLDELPQFINVLKGEMSIVGPRPERPYFIDKFKDEIPDYMQKHLVKAGITGWAQINGWRGDTDLEKRIEYDLFYIENWSLWFDLKIIFLTVFKGFVNKNAY